MTSSSETLGQPKPGRGRLATSMLGPVFATITLRLLVIACFAPPPSWDGSIYAALARSLADGRGYVHWDGSGRATAFFPVGYPAVIAMALRVSSSPSVAVWIVNLVASVIGCALVAWTADRVAGVRAGRIAAWAYACYPSLVLFSAAAMTETLQSTLLVAVLAIIVAARPRDDAHSNRFSLSPLVATVIGGSTLAAACFVRPQAIVLAPVVGALCGRSTRSRVGLASLCTIVVLALAAPWALRNARVLDAPTLYSTNGGSNLLIGTLPSARGGYRELTAADPCGLVVGEVHRDRCMTRAALARIEERPLDWLALAPRKALKVLGYEWSAVSYLRSSSRSFPQRLAMPLAALCTLAWWTLIAFALRVSARRSASATRDAERTARWFTMIASASVLVVHVAFIADDRYHLVVVPLVIVAASKRRS